jgi:hypothetical protein
MNGICRGRRSDPAETMPPSCAARRGVSATSALVPLAPSVKSFATLLPSYRTSVALVRHNESLYPVNGS